MSICLPKPVSDKLKEALKSGELPLAKLYSMTSEERNAMFSHYIGPEFARVVNGEFEKAIVSNQNGALKRWVENTFDPKRPDLKNKAIAKIEKVRELLDPVEGDDFLRDLVSTKIGVDISQEEAALMAKLFDEVQATKAAIDPESPNGTQERIAYGLALDRMKNLTGELIMNDRSMTLADYRKDPMEILYGVGGFAKSVLSSFDNSFFGRQGLKVLLNVKMAPIWFKSFAKSFADIGKQLIAKSHEGMFSGQSDEVMSLIRAEIYSRKNSLNRKYNAARNGYGLGVSTEEAFPTSLPERIPLLGRFFKASEVAFNGAALRMRADLADAIIANAESNGIDMTDREEASSHAKLVTSMTGRGDIGKAEVFGREINALMFSIKFLKSNIDTLTAHQFDSTMTPAAKKQAAYATARIVMSIAVILGIAYAIDPESVEFDPRSSFFGKIKIGNHAFDITGGMGSLVTLASRIIPTVHDGKWGFWTKNKKGEFVQLSTGKFGGRTALDLVENFFEGKLSPLAGIFRDLLEGEDYSGNKPTIKNTVAKLVTPLPINNYLQLQDAGNADGLLSLIGDGFGFSQTQVEKVETEQQRLGQGNLIDLSVAYAKAYGTDPQNALKAMFTPEQLGKVKGNLVELQRFYGKEFDGPGGSEDYVKKELEKMGIPWSERSNYNLEHITPHAAGGDNSAANLQIIDRALHNSYTPFDTALSKSVQDGKMTRKEAEALSAQYKIDKSLTSAEAMSAIRR